MLREGTAASLHPEPSTEGPELLPHWREKRKPRTRRQEGQPEEDTHGGRACGMADHTRQPLSLASALLPH
jgi:hypothetical protein